MTNETVSQETLRRLRADISLLWDEQRVPKRLIAYELGVHESTLSRMLSGDRPTAMSKRFPEIRALVDELLSE